MCSFNFNNQKKVQEKAFLNYSNNNPWPYDDVWHEKSPSVKAGFKGSNIDFTDVSSLSPLSVLKAPTLCPWVSATCCGRR